MGHHGLPAFMTDNELLNLQKDAFATRAPKLNGSLGDILKNAAKDEGLGATEKFPDGKLNDSDEGEIMFGITEFDGRIIMNFGKPVEWIGLTKEQAKLIGESLISHSK